MEFTPLEIEGLCLIKPNVYKDPRGYFFESYNNVAVIKGAVLDVAVDIRKNSKTYGHHVAVELNDENNLMLYIPVGFAHGFLTLKPDTIFSYKCGNVYDKASERGIMWNDPDLNISWNCAHPILSDKDLKNEWFKEFKSPF